MPFIVINAVLAIVSIVAGLLLYNDREDAREQMNNAIHCWQERTRELQVVERERDYYRQLFDRYYEMYRKQTKARGRMHSDYTEILERVGIKTLAYAETGEVIEVNE
jgi:ribulose kinase